MTTGRINQVTKSFPTSHGEPESKLQKAESASHPFLPKKDEMVHRPCFSQKAFSSHCVNEKRRESWKPLHPSLVFGTEMR